MSIDDRDREKREATLLRMQVHREKVLSEKAEQWRLLGRLKEMAIIFGEMAAALTPFAQVSCGHVFDGGCKHCCARRALAAAHKAITEREAEKNE